MTRALVAARVLRWVSPLFGCAALFHLTRVVMPTPGDPSSSTRHLAFVFINVAGAIAVLRRPPWLVYAFVPLLVQQLYSHGRSAYLACGRGEVDFASLGVLLVMPVTFAALWASRGRPA